MYTFFTSGTTINYPNIEVIGKIPQNIPKATSNDDMSNACNCISTHKFVHHNDLVN